MKNNKLRLIVQTSLFLAILVVMQAITKPLGTVVTGSIVNFILISTVLLVGIGGGLVVAVVSPFLAMLLGIVPLPIYLVPVIALGNVVIVLVYWLILKKLDSKKDKTILIFWATAIILGAVLKFGVLYAGVNWLFIPIMTSVKGVPAKAPAALFSFTQMITATVGGFLAFAVVPSVIKARKTTEK